MFSFTFEAPSISGLLNPFAAQAEERERVAPQTAKRKLPGPPRRPSPSPGPVPATAGKKRGWAPTSGATSLQPQTTTASGWIDTPAKYVEQARQGHDDGLDDTDDMLADLPPAKRRRGLADTIISTAFSAALIGTAVGLNAYRLWRDRGQEVNHEEPPPPPYDEGEWVDESRTTQPRGRLPPPPTQAHTPRSRRRQRVTRRRPPIVISPPQAVPKPLASLRREASAGAEPESLDEQMDWMGEKLAHLIAEGKKALGNEVVVMDDDPTFEDEGVMDDGQAGWEDEGEQFVVGSSRSPLGGFVRPSLAVASTPPTSAGSYSAGFSFAAVASPSPTRPARSRHSPPGAGPSGSYFAQEDDDSRLLSERLDSVGRAFKLKRTRS